MSRRGRKAARTGELDLETIRTPAAPVGGLSFGGYRLVREIARGGMGVLYLAEDPRSAVAELRGRKLARRIALKVVLASPAAGRGDDEIARFIDEVRALITCRHPNVVRILDAGADGGRHYYTMELVEGPSLRERLQAGPFPLTMAISVARQVADALSALHDLGLLHRDVKPDNVLLDPRPSPFRPVLIDFGLIARQLPGGGFRGEVAGTPAYMAPEQTSARGRYGKLGPWTDVYGLGACLYHLIAGRPMYLGKSAETLLAGVRQGDAPPIGRIARGVPREVSALVARATSLAPGDRYPDAAAFAADLARLEARLRRSIRVASWWERVRRLRPGRAR